MAETRTRTVAFLFCDTVGSTELLTRLGVDASEELRRRLWAVLREAVGATLGEEVKSLGDGLMIAFPVSSADAVACAIAMQRGVARLNLEKRISILSVRVGLSVGEATLAPEERDWFGPAVNLAARLCAHAAPGQIAASATLVDVVGLPPDAWEQLGALTLKGFDSAVPAVSVLWTADGVEGRVPLPSALDVREGVAFVGRAHELGELMAAWRRAGGGTPSTIVLEGEPGVGKSRLARELAGRCHADGGIVLHGRGDGGAGAGWSGPLAEALRWFVASVAPESLTRDLGPHAAVLSTVVPSLRWRLPDLGRTLSDPAPRLHDALVHALGSVAARNPTLLVLDDVQAVDDQVLAVVDAAQRPGVRLFVVGVYRDDGGPVRWERASRLPVRGLDRDEVVELVGHIAPGAVPASDTTVSEVTGGVARHVIDAARQLAEARTGDGPLDEPARRLLAARSCPYRGLSAFGEEDHTLWFGRDDLLASVLGRLDRARLVALVGASGSGKSSLLHAGVVASLRRGALAGSERWPVATMVPGDDPLLALAAALGALPGVLDDPGAIAVELGTDVNALARIADRLVDDPADRLVVVVDQFEELFRSTAATRDAFVERLLAAASTPGGAVTVVIAVRADFYGALTDVAGLGAAVEANHTLVAPMSEAELAVAVTRPAFVAGLRLEDGLPETVVSDVAGQAGGLPLLSHALLETWRRRQGRTLTLAGYRAAGGVRGAIGRTADDAFVALDDGAQQAMHDLFLRLVTLGEGAEDTRRRVARRELPAAQAALVEPLVATRLLTADDDRVEVAHEALIREWPRLRRWLDEERDTLRVHRHLTMAAAAWEAADHDGTELYGGARLQAALDWADAASRSLNDVETAFLAASQRRQRDSERRRRRLTVGLAALTAVALLASVLAAASQHRATVNARRADAQRHEADLRRLIADARVSETQNLQRALLLAREANLHEPSPRTLGALQTALTSNPPILGYLVDDGVGVYSVDATTDGHTLVAGRLDGTVDVWDVEARHLVERLPAFGDKKPVAVAVDPAGTMLVVARSDGTYASWNLRAHAIMDASLGGVTPTATPPGRLLRPSYVSGLGFLITAGTGVLAVTPDGAPPRLVYRTTGTALSTTATDDGSVIAVAVRRSDQTFAAEIVERDGFRQRISFPIGQGAGLSLLALDPTASHLARTLIGASSATQIFDALTGQPTSEPLVDQEDPLPVYRPDGNELLLPSSGGELSHRDPINGRVDAAPDRLFLSGLYDIRLAAHGERLYAGGADGSVTLVSLTPDNLLARAVPGAVGVASVSPDGTRLAVVAADSTLSLYDTASGRQLTGPVPTGFPVELQQNFKQVAIFSPDGNTIELGSGDGHFLLADGHTGVVRTRISVAPSHPIQSTTKPPGQWDDALFPAGWTTDGTAVAVARWDSVIVIDVATQTVRYEVRGLNDHISDVAFTTDGTLGAAADYDGDVLTFNARDGTTQSKRHGQWVSFLPGTHIQLLTDYFTRVTEVVDGDTGTRVQPPMSSVSLEFPSAATADGRTMFMGSNTARFRMYDRATQLQIGDGFPQPGQLTLPFLFDHDRQAVSGVGQVLVWDVDTAHWGDIACRAAGRNLTGEEWRLYLPPGEPYRPTCPQFPPAT